MNQELLAMSPKIKVMYSFRHRLLKDKFYKSNLNVNNRLKNGCIKLHYFTWFICT